MMLESSIVAKSHGFGLDGQKTIWVAFAAVRARLRFWFGQGFSFGLWPVFWHRSGVGVRENGYVADRSIGLRTANTGPQVRTSRVLVQPARLANRRQSTFRGRIHPIRDQQQPFRQIQNNRLPKAILIPAPSPSTCLLYTSPSPRDQRGSRMPSSA